MLIIEINNIINLIIKNNKKENLIKKSKNNLIYKKEL